MLYRERALRIARGELGVHEQPAGSNSGPRVNEYLRAAGLGPGYPWCAAFVCWAFRQAGLELSFPNRASVGFFEQWGKQHGYLVYEPMPGDVVCYRFDSDNWPDHTGIVENVDGDTITVIEGNTAYGDDANGGKVMRRYRKLARCSFVRIPGDIPDGETPAFKAGRRRVLRDWLLARKHEGRSWAWIKKTANFKEWRRRGGN